MKHIRTDNLDSSPYGKEQDGCAIYLSARKQGQSTFGTLKRSLSALVQMGHRTGFVNGEGDGAGVQTDIPRRLWAKKLSQSGIRSHLATSPGFWVGHIFIPGNLNLPAVRDAISTRFNEAGLNLLLEQPGRVRTEALGQNARVNPPLFWQIAGYSETPDIEKRLFNAQIDIETQFPLHFCSLSSHTVVYKMRGSIESLSRYFLDLQDYTYDTSMVLCHARYSTNTVSNFERAQPFAILGHNGEINTINRLRLEAEQIGVKLPRDGSDSQDVDRLLQTLCVEFGLTLIEAMELTFPPVPYELTCFPPDLRSAYTRVRQSFGPYAQGPAGIVARYGNTIVTSVDALGLRPLWFFETEKEYIFSSERGAIPLENMVTDAHALSPGEKMAIIFQRGENCQVLTHPQIRQQVMVQTFQREAMQLASNYWQGLNYDGKEWQMSNSTRSQEAEQEQTAVSEPSQNEIYIHWADAARPIDLTMLGANGWLRDHLSETQSLISANKDDLVSSLGYDGPLAALSKVRVNLADFFKESVAVVTNPAIDHLREVEAFSTSSMVGVCPPVGNTPCPEDVIINLDTPLLLGGHSSLASTEVMRSVASQFGTMTIEDMIQKFAGRIAFLGLGVKEGETVLSALERLVVEAVQAAGNGAQCLVLDDHETMLKGYGWLDPHLATTKIDEGLRRAPAKENLRRRAGLVVRSAAIRTLHDVALLSGFGADAVNPYALYGVSLRVQDQRVPDERVHGLLSQLVGNLTTGLEKVTSTMGCHELRGYGRVFGSIGLSPSVSALFQCPNFLGSEQGGLNWQRLDEDSAQRGAELRGEITVERLNHHERFLPRFWKKAASYARSEIGYNDVRSYYKQLYTEMPVALRHLVGVKHVTDVLDPMDVSINIGDYDLPLVIDAMSYGSQGEIAYSAYAHAASLLNIICINGEGGELPEMMGKYIKHRGQQVASGRFGVNVEFLNSAAILEIKIGQGAKPGEGGMLPGYKVAPRVAEARHTPPYVTLISPSNNHDLYSIEDLAQLIEELRMVNPQARISVKVPVVPNIGVIVVGIAKAGADIINISGYDGGTGAARKHALQYAGLPVEIGIIQAHRALLDSSIRHKVELWANGGMKTGEDAMKMILLGANRVGFATMAMVAIGCTICRQCNLGSCNKGIATQIQTIEEAKEKGIKNFTPLVYDQAVNQLMRMMRGIGQEVRSLTAQLGVTHTQDLVGRADLLEQIAMQEQIDLSAMFESAPIKERSPWERGVGRLLIRPRNSLTSVISELIVSTVEEDEREVTYQDTVMAYDRALGARLAGELIRHPEIRQKVDTLHLRFGPSSLAGNGFAAWSTDQVDVLIEGGAQDGVAKGANGGRVAVMKGLNHDGLRIDGSVGKSFAYGAQKGILIVQGNADTRACVRLSGADVVLGGEITIPLNGGSTSLGLHANIKGFVCEYMTSGRVIIMGDPGPYAFSGMTGGTVYQKLTPEMGFDEKTLRSRLAKGANVEINSLLGEDIPDIQRLMRYYIEALDQTYQYDSAERMRTLNEEKALMRSFLKVTSKPG